jgi:hypothetical protein
MTKRSKKATSAAMVRRTRFGQDERDGMPVMVHLAERGRMGTGDCLARRRRDRGQGRQKSSRVADEDFRRPRVVSAGGDGEAGARLGGAGACGSAGLTAEGRCGGSRRSRGSGRHRRWGRWHRRGASGRGLRTTD